MATQPDETPEPPKGIRPFAAVFQEHLRGSVHQEASEQLAELVRACVETGKKGALSIKVSVAPEGDYFVVGFDVEPTKPRKAAGTSIFYATPDGGLLKDDPNQMTIGGLRQVRGGHNAQEATGS